MVVVALRRGRVRSPARRDARQPGRVRHARRQPVRAPSSACSRSRPAIAGLRRRAARHRTAAPRARSDFQMLTGLPFLLLLVVGGASVVSRRAVRRDRCSSSFTWITRASSRTACDPGRRPRRRGPPGQARSRARRASASAATPRAWSPTSAHALAGATRHRHAGAADRATGAAAPAPATAVAAAAAPRRRGGLSGAGAARRHATSSVRFGGLQALDERVDRRRAPATSPGSSARTARARPRSST